MDYLLSLNSYLLSAASNVKDDYILSVYEEMLLQYRDWFNSIPEWATATFIGFVVIGFFVAVYNRHKHNLILWLTPVFLFPVLGTICVIIATILTRKYIKKGGTIRPFPIDKLILILIGVFIIISLVLGVPLANTIFNDVIGNQLISVIPVATVFTVLFIYCAAKFHDTRRNYVYFRIARTHDKIEVKRRESKDADSLFVIDTDYNPYSITVREVEKVAHCYENGENVIGVAGWQFATQDKLLMYDVFSDSEYRHRFDVSSVVYLGNGITEIIAYDWERNENDSIILGTGHVMSFEESDNATVKPYRKEKNAVREIKLYSYAKSVKHTILAAVEMFAVALLLFTPLGVNINQTVAKLLMLLTDLL